MKQESTRKKKTKELRVATNRRAQVTEQQAERGGLALLCRQLALRKVRIQIPFICVAFIL